MPKSDTDASFRRLVIWPLAAVAVLAWIAIRVRDPDGGIAVVAGGAVSMIPAGIMAYRFRAWRLAGREPGLGRMLVWEASKWLSTAVLFTAVFIGYKLIGHGEIPAVWLFGGFIAAQLAHMVALMRVLDPEVKKPGKHDGGRQSDQL